MEFFGGNQRKAFRKVEAHLIAEHRTGAGAGTVGFVRTVFHDVPQQIQILFHDGNGDCPYGIGKSKSK